MKDWKKRLQCITVAFTLLCMDGFSAASQDRLTDFNSSSNKWSYEKNHTSL